MALRWKKNPKPTGLRSIGAGVMGSTLRVDGEKRAATVSPLHKSTSSWYWVAGWDCKNIPYKNTCNEPVSSEQEAKEEAMKYVRQFLAS